MLEIFKTEENSHELIKVDTFEKGCWINLTHPTEEELLLIESNLGVLPEFLRDPLDEEEKPRIDVDENQTLIIVDTPYIYTEQEGEPVYETIPLGIIVTDDYIFTLSSKENIVTDYFRTTKVKGVYSYKKTRFTFQILFRIAKDFLKYLRIIDKKTDEARKHLQKSMKNKEIFELLELERSLVFFTTSLKSNEIVLDKLFKGRHIKMYEEDQDLLEDVIIENKQALEMVDIYSSILSGMMDAYASVISNNLNIVMKFLTSVTIVMTVPTMIASFFGMNVPLPFGLESNPFSFAIILGGSLVVMLGAVIILSKKRMF
ncbi:MAG: magnesium transporter CorA family protein [Eubacteriales bacterium]|nr:magnesium transporter CorA family protein [Eubacteriales bacterium]